MADDRPVLIVLPGASAAQSQLQTALGKRYDIRVLDSLEELGTLPKGAVLLDSDRLTRLLLATPSSATRHQEESGTMLNAIGEGLCLASADGAMIWANERFLSFDEPTRARILAACRRAVPTLNEHIERRIVSVGDSSENNRGEAFRTIRTRCDVALADQSRFLEVVVSPVPTRDNEHLPIERVAAVVWDVTESRRFQQKTEAIDQAGAELVRIDADLIRSMHVGERLKLLEDKIVRFAHDLMHFDHFSIRLIERESNRLELVMATGLPPEAMDIELSVLSESNGIMGYVAATGRSYNCPDVTTDRRYLDGLTNARSSLTVPLRLFDRIIGVFNVESEQPAAFSEEDRQFAEMFSNHIALALHILDLLVAERVVTGQSITGSVEGELNEPIEDLMHEVDWLRSLSAKDPSMRDHIERITGDIESIRNKVREAAAGPQTILGAHQAIARSHIDPQLLGKRILVVDDEDNICRIIRDVLKARGAQVTSCNTGSIAIEQIEAHAHEPFDLVVSDIKLPDHNGYEVYAAVHRTAPDLPVILMTGFGYDPHHSIVRASQEGLQCVLFKPFQADRLIEEVYKAMQLESPNDTHASR